MLDGSLNIDRSQEPKATTRMSRRMEQSVVLNVLPEAAYDFVTTLRNWRRWYPGTIDMRGQTDLPAVAGDTVIETVRKFGVNGTLHWVVVESVRPRRFVIETTWVKMPMMRRSQLRVIYTFVPQKDSRATATRMVRAFEYEFTGIARVLDRLYLHQSLKRKSAAALTGLKGLVAREVAEGSLRDAV